MTSAKSAPGSANPNPPEWGFGRPTSKKLDFGDTYIFYCQQVHDSPVRRADSFRLSVEIRAACRRWTIIPATEGYFPV